MWSRHDRFGFGFHFNSSTISRLLWQSPLGALNDIVAPTDTSYMKLDAKLGRVPLPNVRCVE